MTLNKTPLEKKVDRNRRIFCNACRYEYMTASTKVCPKCGYPYLEFPTNKQKWNKDIQYYRDISGIHMASLKIGQIYRMGVYQDEEITWRVLAVKNGAALLISEKGLDAKPFHNALKGSAWDESDIRKWLNSEFIAGSFKKEDEECIYTSFVPSGNNTEYPTNQGKGVNDKIYLLSINEVRRYFPGNREREAEATPYSISQGGYVNDRGKCCWWLRSLGCDNNIVAYVRTDGRVITEGSDCNDTDVCIRPAIWVNLFLLHAEEVLQAESDQAETDQAEKAQDETDIINDSISSNEVGEIDDVSDASIETIWDKLKEKGRGWKASLLRVCSNIENTGKKLRFNKADIKKWFTDVFELIADEKYYKTIIAGLAGMLVFSGSVILAMNISIKTDRSMEKNAIVQDEEYYGSMASSGHIGQVISFGNYEQDNRDSNGMEPIKWIIVDKKEDTYLLVSKQGLDAKPYHENNVAITWKNSSLRKWLNEGFYKIAFSDSEKEKIQTTLVETEENPYYGTTYNNKITKTSHT